jgi:hypothetical protein
MNAIVRAILTLPSTLRLLQFNRELKPANAESVS